MVGYSNHSNYAMNLLYSLNSKNYCISCFLLLLLLHVNGVFCEQLFHRLGGGGVCLCSIFA